MTSIAGDVLRWAAANVEVRGVTRLPHLRLGETCAVLAVKYIAAKTAPDLPARWHLEGLALDVLSAAAGVKSAVTWNDSQPSKATIAATMRSAADLADLLYGGTT